MCVCVCVCVCVLTDRFSNMICMTSFMRGVKSFSRARHKSPTTPTVVMHTCSSRREEGRGGRGGEGRKGERSREREGRREEGGEKRGREEWEEERRQKEVEV